MINSLKINNLQRLQRHAFAGITGAMKTASNASLQVIAGILPFNIFISFGASDTMKLQLSYPLDKYRIYSAIAFIIVIVIIGVPMWWKTTEVYRVSLPRSGIESLDQTPIEVSAQIGIFISDPKRLDHTINELGDGFKDHPFLKLHFIPLSIDSDLLASIKTPANLEKHILNKYKFTYGDFLFLEWNKLMDEILVTADRTAFVSSTVSINKIMNVLKNWIFEEHKLRSILGNLTTSDGIAVRNVNAPPQPEIDILISVLNPRPDLQNVLWNVRKASENYIGTFLESISVLSNFTLKSQWKYQLEFEFTSKQVRDDSKLQRHYALPEDSLPHIITSIERKLGNEVSKNRCIHLIVYVPPCLKAPLYIYKRNGERASNNSVNSFVSANWGGIIIANPPESQCIKYMETEEKVEFHLNSQDIMQVGLHLLRSIFGIQNDIPINGAGVVSLDTLTPRTWEIETFVRTRVVHLLASATLTLKSLIKLLGDISYIVINDDVGSAINDAYANIIIAKQYLRAGDLQTAVKYAKQAFQNSERAFFDPTLLALLYFPDEQKYAIYIPLFLPIMIPVILSLSLLKKYFSKKSDTDDEPEDASTSDQTTQPKEEKGDGVTVVKNITLLPKKKPKKE